MWEPLEHCAMSHAHTSTEHRCVHAHTYTHILSNVMHTHTHNTLTPSKGRCPAGQRNCLLPHTFSGAACVASGGTGWAKPLRLLRTHSGAKREAGANSQDP